MICPYLRTGSPSRDGRDRHLVPARHALARDHAGGNSAGRNLIDGDNDIVFGRKPDGSWCGHETPDSFAPARGQVGN